jgi:hypothetical protein
MKFKKDFLKIYAKLLLIAFVVMGFMSMNMQDFDFNLFWIVPLILFFFVLILAIWQIWVRIKKLVIGERKTYKIKK